MKGRQTSQAWFIVDRPADRVLLDAVRHLPCGAGLLVLSGNGSRALSRLARSRELVLVNDGVEAARVHDLRELRSALLRRTSVILLSPIFPTRSHPDWRPVPRMRAAAFARLANRSLFALGGMDSRRFARIAPLGFAGWAGISAWVGALKS